MATSTNSSSKRPLNWTAVAGLYAGLLIGVIWMLYWGEYRNVAWLLLLGTGGGLTAMGRWKENQGDDVAARRWQRASAVVYAVFLVWLGTVFFRSVLSG